MHRGAHERDDLQQVAEVQPVAGGVEPGVAGQSVGLCFQAVDVCGGAGVERESALEGLGERGGRLRKSREQPPHE